ncbi:flagellar hook-associated protein FlgL [Noviherbaspirillum aerium]|uniref:flagellar hook-associated protein FlgL n=1 Tax=Noviherbaspirillum aerium TaxID=2588497 RepID=UPI00124C8C55|nr:flagellar hook-associated protein FlgL [Noviherbaspirillum aerium]
MRISTSSLFESGRVRMSELQSGLSKTQQQLAANKRILTPADDPLAAAQALEVTQSKEVNAQYAVNRQAATNSLSLEEHVLQSVTTLIQNVQTLAVSAGNPALSDVERKFMATELNGRLEELIGLANTRDGTGNFLFSGYQSTTQPFARTSSGASYAADQGQRNLQVGPARQIAISDSGDAVFERIRTGNGKFATSPGSPAGPDTNTGSGVISSGAMLPGPGYDGRQYEIRFGADPATFQIFDVTDSAAGTAIGAAANYKSGESINVDGKLRVEITGTPATGDTFSIKPSTNQNVFSTLQNLVNALETPASGAAGGARLSNSLNSALNNLSNALDNVLTVRASVGARLNELEALDGQGEAIDVQYADRLSTLQDLDYTKAITDLSMQKFTLEAAQQSFVKTSGLSLFNFI